MKKKPNQGTLSGGPVVKEDSMFLTQGRWVRSLVGRTKIPYAQKRGKKPKCMFSGGDR